ncbi:MAG: cupin domain-containing protein [Polyangiales bacterium]
MSNRLTNKEPAAEELDLLADIVSSSHKGSLYHRGWYAGRWNLGFDAAESRGFHIVMKGTVFIRTSDGAVHELHPGDIALLSTEHQLASDLASPPVPFSAKAARALNGEGADICMLCGAYQLEDAESHLVFSNLPPIIVLRSGERDASVDMLVSLLDREFREGAPGTRTIASRLVDAMLVYILRHWIESDCPTALTWLKALRDPNLARALTLIHKHYDQDWTLESLARASGMSRATLARNFASEVGSSPIHFLTERRLSAAKDLLARTSLSLEEVAKSVGYGSAFSLSKAFKRAYGQSPTHHVSRPV